MPWCKPKDKEPLNQDDEYFIRNGGDKYIGWWDKERKEFLIQEGNYATEEEYPNIEWWEEEEANQDVLWVEIMGAIRANLKYDLPSQELADTLRASYTLIRK